MSETNADLCRLAQVQKLMDLFEDANGRPVRTTEELERWMQSPAGQAATADHLTTQGKVIP
jgi:hypothetical protein